MNLKKNYITILLLLTFVYLYGCAASSSNERYSKSERKIKTDTVKVTRYSNPQVTKSDTSNVYNDDEDDSVDEVDSVMLGEDNVLLDKLLKKYYDIEAQSADVNSVNSQEKFNYGGNQVS